jgi:integrase
LRAALLELERETFRPSPSRRVLEGVDPSNWCKRQWRRICAGAGIGHHAITDLRGTYASQLLTSGAQLGYVSVQLCHSDVSVTADHYARRAGGDQYRAPVPLIPGGDPADLLARLGAVSAQRQ